MLDEANHAGIVDAWLRPSADGLSRELLLQLFEDAFCALWECTKNTLGDVTLTAIADRVLYNASEKFPIFASAKVEPGVGIQVRELRDRAASLNPAELTEGIRFVLVEFLTVLGNLTAEILTPELHAELVKITPVSAPTKP
jgi:hypothetical protein